MPRVYVIVCLLFSLMSYGQSDLVAPTTTFSEKASFTVAEYPGCRGDNEFLKKCFTEKVYEHLFKNFNSNVLDALIMPDGKHTIITQFMVNKKGKVRKIEAKGPHQELEWEAIRALRSLPKMGPALSNGIPIETYYRIPILLEMKDNRIMNVVEIN